VTGTQIIASLVGLFALIAGFVIWAYRRGIKEGEKKSNEKSNKTMHDEIIPLMGDPNHLFDIVRKTDKKD
jgi:hypothetical protein